MESRQGIIWNDLYPVLERVPGLYCLHFSWHSACPNSYQNDPLSSIYSILVLFSVRVSNFCSPVPAAKEPHSQMYHSSDPVSWFCVSVLLTAMREYVWHKKGRFNFSSEIQFVIFGMLLCGRGVRSGLHCICSQEPQYLCSALLFVQPKVALGLPTIYG